MSSFRFLLICQLLLLTIILSAIKYNQPTPSVPLQSPPPKWGAYVGSQAQDLLDFESIVGKQPDYVGLFINWADKQSLPVGLVNLVKSRGQTLVIYWEAMDYNYAGSFPDNRFSYDQILAGTHDDYLQSFAQEIINYDAPVILVPFEEMNGDWYPWSVTVNGNSAVKHIAAYRYLADHFKDMPKVQLAWVVNNTSVPNTAENNYLNYYPGDDYVDIVGVDGFNFDDPWKNFSQIFDQPISWLATLNKPIMIFSMACAPGPQKSDWIEDAAVYLKSKSNVIGWIWFNENKEKDWRVWSDPMALQSFSQNLLNLNNPLPGSR